jgi:hypothetical protein
MGGGDSQTSPFTSVTRSDLERLPEEEIEELREQLQTTLGEHESVPGVTSLDTSDTDIPQIRVGDADGDAASEVRARLGGESDDAAGGAAAGGSPPASGGASGGRSPGSQAPQQAGTGADAGVTAAGIDPPDLSGADSMGDYARTLFDHEGSVSPPNREGGGEESPPVVSDDGTVGGWHSFEMPGESHRTPLRDADEVTGRTAADMEKVDISEVPVDGDYGTETAFVTNYGPDNNTRLVYGGSEVGASTFAEELGANVPSHVYDPDGEYVAAEAFPGDAVRECDRETMRKVDGDQLTDTLAVQVLMGNDDLHSGNVFLSDDGEAACIDLDMAGKEFVDKDSLQKRISNSTMGRIERAGGPEVSKEDIADRAQEIAVALHNNDDVERIVTKTKNAEAAVSGRTDVGDAVENNIKMLVEEAQQSGGGA